MMIRSVNEGESWSAPRKIYESNAGEPQTMGTLTKLASGKLVVAVTEIGEQSKPHQVILLFSQDNGQSWDASGPLTLPGVNRTSVCGRLIETTNGTMLMSIFGSLAGEDSNGVPGAGLLRSTDGGRSWGDLSVIASDPDREFTQPAVLSTGKDSLVAMVNSRELLYRSESSDGGRHWSEPDQVLLGREPHLFRIDNQGMACLTVKGAVAKKLGEGGWGLILINVSYDNGKSWRCQRKVMENIRRAAQDRRAHFGWPVGLALDSDRILVGFGRSQLPVWEREGPSSKSVSIDEERIAVAFFQRERQSPQLSRSSKITPEALRDRWEQTGPEVQIPPMTTLNGTPDGELMGITGVQSWIQVSEGREPYVTVGASGTGEQFLRSTGGISHWQRQPFNVTSELRGDPHAVRQTSSGRLIAIVQEWFVNVESGAPVEVIGDRGGYPQWTTDRGTMLKDRIFVLHSADQGKTWQGADNPIDTSPMDWINASELIELGDGTLVMLGYGCLSEKDTRMRLDCCAVFRSTDGGHSWGDFSVIAHDKEDRRIAYNEFGIAFVSDKIWVAFMRHEQRDVGNELAEMARAISTDGGYTWSPPELLFADGEPQVAVLPDGGIAVRSKNELRFTYDWGRTFTRAAPVGGHPPRAILIDKDTLLSGAGPFWKRQPARKTAP